MSLSLVSATLADLVIYLFGGNLLMVIIGVALLGLGFIFTHSTLLTRATEFAHKERGAAMSLWPCALWAAELARRSEGRSYPPQASATFSRFMDLPLRLRYF